MHDFIMRLDKKWGKRTVFWAMVVIFILLLCIAGSFFVSNDYNYTVDRNGNTVYTYGRDAMGTGGSKVTSFFTRIGLNPSAPVHMQRGEATTMTVKYGTLPPMYGAPAATAKPSPVRDVVRSGSLDLVVSDADVLVSSATSIAQRYGGYVDSMHLTEIANEKKVGNISLRVPAAQFTVAMDAVKTVAIKVKNEYVNSYDVSDQVVDYQAQLENLKAEEAQYAQLLEQTKDANAIVVITSQLTNIRSQIRWTEGQINGVGRQVAMSTISINIEAQPEIDIFGINWKPFTTIKQACRLFLQNLTYFIDGLIIFIFQIPIILLQLLLIVGLVSVVWHVAMWLKRILTGEKR